MSYSRGECGDFASVQLREGWERLIVRSMVRWRRRRIEGMFFVEPYTFFINWDKLRTAYKIVKDRKS